MALFPLDGPAEYDAISVTDTPIEVKVGASPLDERKVVTIQPTDGFVFFGYDNSVSSTTGTKVFKNQVYPFEANSSLSIWVVAATGETVDVRITEVA